MPEHMAEQGREDRERLSGGRRRRASPVERAGRRSPQELRERLEAIIANLDREAEERVAQRDVIEKRWLEDLRQYHGKYADSVLLSLQEAKKSQLFVNLTRSKTNTLKARLADMLFPTDDRNWEIQPTPVPDLVVSAEQAAQAKARAHERLEQNPDDVEAQDILARASQTAEQIRLRMDEARLRAKAMQEEIDDVLKECQYEAQVREIIDDACELGTGILKGPVIGGRSRRSWQQSDDGVYELMYVADQRPMFWRVDPWHWFPDMHATRLEDCESFFERHLLTKKQLRALAREPGFDQDAIRRLLRDAPRYTLPHFISELRSITGAYHDTADDRYCVWEYHGPLSAEDMASVAYALGQEGMLGDLDLDDIDPLQELQVIIWFCQGEVLKFGIHPLDSGDPIYSVFNLEKDPGGVFGFGLPYIMRASQAALNAGWRGMMDNAGLSTGPQIVIDQEWIEPANGEWALEPRKIWWKRRGAPPGLKVFETYDIPMYQVELANIIELARRNIDEETGITVIAQGEQGAHTTQTAQGMTLLMNASNIVFRRYVKNFDDQLTTPTIRRIYDWLMQFSPKEHIKGDFEVHARGTSVLLVREMQSANLMTFLNAFAGHPILGRFLRADGLPALRKLVQTMMISPDEVIKSDDELRQEEAEAKNHPPPPNPDMEKIAAQLNMKQMEIQARLELAYIERETAMLQLAAKGNIDLEKIKAMLYDKERDRQSKERILAAEVAAEERLSARGVAQGSGGYVSAGGAKANGSARQGSR